MKGIKKILKKGSTIPIFLQNIDVTKTPNVMIVKKRNKILSYKSLVIILIIFIQVKSYPFNDIFLNYCKNTNKAELFIIENNLEQALIYYDSAFLLYQKPLAKDIHNAIVCSKKMKDENRVRKYLKLMIITKKLNPKYYRKEKLMKYLSNDDKKNIKERYYYKIHSKDHAFLHELIKKDQSVKKIKNHYTRNILINNLAKNTFNEFEKYFNEDIPGEELMLNFPCAQRKDYVLFLHWFQCHLDVVTMTEKLVEDLKLINTDYAYMYDMMQGTILYYSKYGLILKQRKNKTIPIKLTSEQIEEIDKNRAKIGMDTYSEYVKKINFFVKNKEYCYNKSYYVVKIG